MIEFNERCGEPLTLAEKDQLIKEGVTWWRRYGLSDRPVIDNYADFDAYWNHMLDHELERNVTTDYALAAGSETIPAPPQVPVWLWKIVRRPTVGFSVWIANAFMPPRAREVLGLTWMARDERRLRLLTGVVRRTWPLMPERVRYLPPRLRKHQARTNCSVSVLLFTLNHSADIGRQRSARQQNLDEHPGRKLPPAMHLDFSLHQDVAADNEFTGLRAGLRELGQLEELAQPDRSIGFDRGDAVDTHT